jgi:hypothetical protein
MLIEASNVLGNAFVSYFRYNEHPACSFDFGQNGFAASCNYGGELLQVTAPSDDYGILFARGDFEYSLYLSLARGQRTKGGKSSFGLKMASTPEPPDNKVRTQFRSMVPETL